MASSRGGETLLENARLAAELADGLLEEALRMIILQGC
jgi:hypothetical protein